MTASSSTLISLGKELVRINPSNNHIEASTTQGRTWMVRYSGSYCGTFASLVVHDGELLAATSKGVAASTNEGRTWTLRYTGTICGEFQQLTSTGSELLATTSRGLYASKNNGRTWMKRH